MADQSQKRRRIPLENRNKTWLGDIAVVVVTVVIGAMLIV